MNNSIIELVRSSKKVVALSTTAILIVSGFFVAGTASAAHTTTVTVEPVYVSGASSNTYIFEVTNGGVDDIYFIKITVPTGFTITDDVVCPEDVSETYDWASSYTSDYATCQTSGNPANENLISQDDSAIIQFSATSNNPETDVLSQWVVYSEDNAWGTYTNNTDAQTTVDVMAPTTSDNAPEGWQITKPVAVNLICNDGSGSGCMVTKYTTDGSDPQTSETAQEGTTISISEEGETTIKYYSTDAVGNEEEVKTDTVQIDTESPVTSDDASSVWTNSDVTVTLTAEDGTVGSGIAHIYYTTDGSGPTTDSAEYTTSFTLVDSGSYQLRYFSVDNAGNSEVPVTGTNVGIDKEDPVTTFAIDPTEPGLNGWYVTVPTITLTCGDQENLSGCDRTFYKWNDAESFTEYTNSISAPEGDNTLYYYSTDVAGNQQDTQTQTVKVDITHPTITDNAPTGWQNEAVSFSLSPDDNLSGIKEVRLDGVVLDSPYSITLETAGVFTGEYQVWDNAGNASDIGSYTVQIDLTSPIAEANGAPLDWENTDQTASTGCSDEGGSTCDAGSYKLQVSTIPLESCSADEVDYTVDSPVTISEHSWVCSYVKDIAGNEDFSDVPVEFMVDQTNPTGELTGIPPVWQNTEATIGLIPNDEGGSEVANSYLDQVSYGDACEAVTLYEGEITVLGYSTVCWKVVDVAGNENTGSEEVQVDQTNPNVNAGLDKTTNTQFTQDATVSDEDSGVAAYLWEQISGPDGGTVTFNTPAAEDTTISADLDGTYIIRLTVTDNAGNSAFDEMTLVWDTETPTITIASPEYTVYKSESVNLTFTPTDPDPGTALTCSYQVDGGEAVPVSCESEVEAVETVLSLLDGRRTITLAVTDAAGNSVSEDVSFVVDLDNTLTVGPTGYDFTSIQEAVTKSTAGDAIEIAAATYNESVTIDKQLSIVGAGNTATIIQPTIDTDGITIAADDVVLKDLKIVTSNSGIAPNKAISVEEADNLEINNIVVETTGDKAMGVWIGGSNNGMEPVSGLTIVKSNITVNNEATGIYADHSTPAHGGWVIGGSAENENTVTVPLGNPVELYDVSDSEVSYNTITTSASGGSATIWSSEWSDISNLVFNYNTVDYSGGSQVAFITDFPVTDTTDTTISTVTITGNTFSNWGVRALRIGDGDGSDTGTVTGITITSNTFNMSVASEVIGGTDAESTTGSGNTFNVQEPATIQDAINSAFSGDTINVAAGTYAGDLTVDKGVVLLGAKQNIDPAGSTDRVGESVINGEITITGTGAEINGFKISDRRIRVNQAENVTIKYNIVENSNTHGIYIEPSSPNTQVLYNTVSGPEWQGISNQGNLGVIISYNYVTGVTDQHPIESTNHAGIGIEITHNVITGNTGTKGINYWGGSGVIISYNEISDVTYEAIYTEKTSTVQGNIINGCNDGIALFSAASESVVSDNQISNCNYAGISVKSGVAKVTIADNTISNTGSTGIELYQTAVSSDTEKSIVSGNTITATKYQGIAVFGRAYTEISGNTLSGCNYYGADETGDWDYAAIHVQDLGGESSDYTTIIGNIVSNGINGIQTWSSNVTITGNEIYGMGDTYADEKVVGDRTYKNSAILIGSNFGSADDMDPIEVVIEDNKIYDNYWGLFYNADLTNGVTAEANWWGSANGPTNELNNPYGDGDAISDNVDFAPWYTNAELTDLDEDAPTATLSGTPSDPTSQKTADITVGGEGVIYYKYNLDGEGYGEETPVVTTITLSELSEGSHTIEVLGRDQAGNWQEAATDYTWEVDATAPTLNSVSIASNNADTSLAKVGDTITLSFTSSEEIKNLVVYIAGKSASVSNIENDWQSTYTMASEDAEGLITFSVDFDDLADNHGNQVTAVTDASSVTFDSTAPVVGITAPTEEDKVNGDEVISFETDESSPQCSVDNTNWTTCETGTTVLNDITEFAELAEGTFTLYLRDTDAAGNIGTDSISLTKDTVAPSVSSHVPTVNAVNVEPANDIVVTFSEAVIVETANVSFSPEFTDFTVQNSGTDVITISPDTALESNTNYTVTLSGVVDLAGNVMADYDDISFTTATFYDIPLYSAAGGWNLISLPVVPNETNISTVLGDAASDINEVWAYAPNHANADDSGWLMYAPGDPEETNNLDIMTTGYGYWISTTNNTNIQGWGSLLTAGPTVPPSRTLNSGWNLVGYYQIPGETSSTPSQAFASLQSDYTGLWGYDNAGGVFKSTVSTILPGDAFWISLTESKEYTPSN